MRILSDFIALVNKLRTYEQVVNNMESLERRERAESKEEKYGKPFARMMRLAKRQALPKGVVAKGFEEGFINVAGRVYLIKHGTHYRLDKLIASGRAKFGAVSRASSKVTSYPSFFSSYAETRPAKFGAV